MFVGCKNAGSCFSLLFLCILFFKPIEDVAQQFFLAADIQNILKFVVKNLLCVLEKPLIGFSSVPTILQTPCAPYIITSFTWNIATNLPVRPLSVGIL